MLPEENIENYKCPNCCAPIYFLQLRKRTFQCSKCETKFKSNRDKAFKKAAKAGVYSFFVFEILLILFFLGFEYFAFEKHDLGMVMYGAIRGAIVPFFASCSYSSWVMKKNIIIYRAPK